MDNVLLETEMMNISEFANYVKDELYRRMDKENGVLEVRSVIKNNGRTYIGLTYRIKKSNIAPTVYLEEFHERYLKGEEIDNLIGTIMAILMTHSIKEKCNIDFFLDYENVSDRVVCKLIGRSRNSRLLDDVPYVEYLDMAIVFYYIIENESFGLPIDDELVSASIMIHNCHLNMWKIDVSRLYEDAIKNTPVLLPKLVIDMNSMFNKFLVEKMLDSPLNSEDSDALGVAKMLVDNSYGDSLPTMLALTNEDRRNGAAVVLYDNSLKDIADKYDNDLYIIPSSIHEVIVIPDNDCLDKNAIKDMVGYVNAHELSPEEVLTDSLYYYSRYEGVMTVV